MRRDQKAVLIEEIAARIGEANAIYAVDYRGLSVSQAAALRASLRDAGATFRIVKNTLTLRAADQVGAEHVKVLVEGPTAFTFVRGDAAMAAKALDSFSRRERVLELRGGVLDGVPLSADAVRLIARLPARDQLNAQLAGMVAAPLTGLARGLGALLSGIAIALGQVREQRKDEPGAEEAPQAQAVAETAETAETTETTETTEAAEAEAAAPEPETAGEQPEAAGEGATEEPGEAAEEPGDATEGQKEAE
jgi:large subunit ribosomal protein L10